MGILLQVLSTVTSAVSDPLPLLHCVEHRLMCCIQSAAMYRMSTTMAERLRQRRNAICPAPVILPISVAEMG